jgi:hypothetical protein
MPKPFRGLGNGGFRATLAVQLQLKLAGVWVDYLAYVAPVHALDERVLVGSEFMEVFGVVLDMHRKMVLIDPKRLMRGNYIR